MTIEEFKELVALTITNKTDDYSISPNDVGGRFDDLADLIPTTSSTSVPVGTILMYAPASTSEFDLSGLGISGTNVQGWAICNGNGGTYNGVEYTTPNLKGKFVVGYDPADADYNTIGETGGVKVTELPEHTHHIAVNHQNESDANKFSENQVLAANAYIDGWSATAQGDYDLARSTTTTVPTLGIVERVGVTDPDNRPPYYTVLYIKKVA